MSELYASAPIAIRDDLAAAHTRAWRRIGRPGTWWDGAQRVAIAAETRQAPSCPLCLRREEAPSPAAIEGKHDSLGALPEAVGAGRFHQRATEETSNCNVRFIA